MSTDEIYDEIEWFCDNCFETNVSIIGFEPGDIVEFEQECTCCNHVNVVKMLPDDLEPSTYLANNDYDEPIDNSYTPF